ncbi:BrnT family toxin [Cyanobacteria bacterium FACHB-DQ100]|nr:BrnT family toxin [Cyanobacteria bacterium FACHB-DQ100]
MEFEFDPNKSAANQVKHGIDFNQAQQLWTDSERVEIPARTEDEQRFLVIGKISQQYWAAVITYRAEMVRIISVRRARDSEVELYESRRI